MPMCQFKCILIMHPVCVKRIVVTACECLIGNQMKPCEGSKIRRTKQRKQQQKKKKKRDTVLFGNNRVLFHFRYFR
mgnify:CR=1 FL=1